MDLFAIYTLLLRKKWYIILLPLATGIIALLLSELLQKQYRSVEKLSTGFTTKSSISLDDERFNFAQTQLDFSNLIETMKSEMILSMVSYNLLSHDITSSTPFRFNADSIEFYKTKLNLEVLDNKKDSFLLLSRQSEEENYIINLLDDHEYLGWQFLQSINIYRVRDTDYVNIECLSENPYLSSFIVNNIADELIRYYNYTNSTLSNKSVKFFQEEVNKKKALLDIQIEELNQYKINHPLQDDAEKAALLSQLIQYEILRDESIRNITKLKFSNDNLTAQLEKINAKSSISDNNRIIALRERLNELTKMYIDGGSKDKNLEQTISNVRNQLAIEMRLLDTSSNPSLMSAEEILAEKEANDLEIRFENVNLRRINDQINSIRAETGASNSGSANLGALERQLDDALSEYQAAVDRLDLEKSKSLLTASSVKVAVRGQPKFEPESQKRKLIILFASFTTLMLTIATIIGFDLVDIRVKSQKDFEKNVPLKLIGQLNRVDLANFQISSIFKQNLESTNETFTQLLRKIRHYIDLTSKQCIVVTSPNESDGKTFFVMSIAYSLSLINKRVLIIDTNFKNNTLSKLLAPKTKFKLLNSSRNFSNTLLIGDGGNTDTNQDNKKESFLIPTIYKNIDIIGNNGGVNSPLELFSGRDFNSMILKLKETYDYILLEGPSLNSYSDTMELVDFADGVICVLKAGSIINQKDKESFTYLNSLNGKLVGGVLNKVEEQDLV